MHYIVGSFLLACLDRRSHEESINLFQSFFFISLYYPFKMKKYNYACKAVYPYAWLDINFDPAH